MSTEELYRKTLEELRKLRESEIKEGIGEPPSALSEQLIQAGNKGQLLGGKQGEMGTGQQDRALGSKLRELKGGKLQEKDNKPPW